ncbi:MAG: SPOR domain-containing protein [Alphaproteobacteria bacterium]|nr:SPOR domain-containing protein [Alphaproteobacteria bacterium]
MTSHREHFLRQPLGQSDGKDDGSGSFTDPVFDDEYYGRDQAGGRGRTIGLIVGVVAGAVIAGIAAWTVFGPGSGLEGGRTPLIVAEPEPYKVRPKDPGGMQVENQDKLVYERVGGATSAPGAENILPPPEAPKAPAPAAVAAVPTPAPVSEPVPESAPAPVPVVDPSPKSAPTPAVVAPDPEVAPAPLVAPAPVVVETPQPAPVAAPSAPETPEPTLEDMVAALSGDYLIQIAALRSQEAAEGEWQRISSRHSNLLGAYREKIVRVDLGERGIFFRLRAGPLKDRGAAEDLCEALAAENVGCLVVRNE